MKLLVQGDKMIDVYGPYGDHIRASANEDTWTIQVNGRYVGRVERELHDDQKTIWRKTCDICKFVTIDPARRVTKCRK